MTLTSQRHPETREEYGLKNLRKIERLGYDFDRMLMVDDEPARLEKTTATTSPSRRSPLPRTMPKSHCWPATL
ncbi:MAG TPA: hypothetical protein DIT64_04850 [Verrucomicrobiales bacterium]|nr:hypothetical protein [Verrucomicrobiales bacterium]